MSKTKNKAEPPINASRFSGPSESPGFLFWSDFMHWQRELNQKLAPFDVTQPQFALLAVVGWLLKDGEEVNQQLVADTAKIDRMLVSQVIAKLAKKNLIERSQGSLDKRSNQLVLTSKGADILAKCLPIVEAHDSDFFAALEDTKN